MSAFTYSNEIASVIQQSLDKNGWPYSFDEEWGIFEFEVSTSQKIQAINYLIDVKDNEAIFYGICPLGADCQDDAMMARMSEFLTRVNCGLKNGSFELNYDRGSIKYKCYVDCDGVLPSIEVARNCILCIYTMYKRYAHGIVGIIFNKYSAKEAFEECQTSSEQELADMISALGLDEELKGADISEILTFLEKKIGLTEEDEEGTTEQPLSKAS